VRILVVEAKPPVRHAIDIMLTRRQHHVILAASIFEAMAALIDHDMSPEIALLDHAVAGMGGFAYAERLVRQFPGLRVIIMATGGGDDAAVRGWAFLAKPFTFRELVDAVEQ